MQSPQTVLAQLCGNHLLGRHRQLHSIYRRIKRRTYNQDQETADWSGRMPELYAYHELVVAEMTRRHYDHRSPIPFEPGSEVQLVLPGTATRLEIADTACGCKVGPERARRAVARRRERAQRARTRPTLRRAA